MKKVVYIFLIILLFSTIVKADTEEKYYIKDCMVIFNKDKWDVVVRESENLDESDKKQMIENDIFLTAREKATNPLLLYVSIKKMDDLPNLHTLTNDEIEEVIDGIKQEVPFENTIKGSFIYEVNGYKYVVLDYNESEYDVRLYMTQINGNMYGFKIGKSTVLDFYDKTGIRNIIDSIIFKIDSSYEKKESTVFSKAIEKAIIVIITGIIIGLIQIATSKIKKEKETNNGSNNKEKESELIDEKYVCYKCGKPIKQEMDKCPYCHAEFDWNNEEQEKEEIINSTDHNIQEQKGKSKKDKDSDIRLFKCSSCGVLVKETAKKCPNCGESFEDENVNTIQDNNVNQKYSDLKKLKELLDEKIITKEEFEKEKKKILK